MSRTTLLAVLAAVAMGGLRAAAEQPEILVEVTPEQVYEGQPVRYRVTLNHVEAPSPPELVGFDDFDVTSLGQRSLDSRQVTIINGRVSEVVRRGRQYDYRLTPRKTGMLTIPGPVARVDGQVLTGPEQTVLVRPHGGFFAPLGNPRGGREMAQLLFHQQRAVLTLDRLYHDNTPMEAGRQIQSVGATVKITAITDDGRPAEAAFRFVMDLENPCFRWMRWEDGAYVPFVLPAVGQTVTLPAAAVPF